MPPYKSPFTITVQLPVELPGDLFCEFSIAYTSPSNPVIRQLET
jgi:hypothetical protein